MTEPTDISAGLLHQILLTLCRVDYSAREINSLPEKANLLAQFREVLRGKLAITYAGANIPNGIDYESVRGTLLLLIRVGKSNREMVIDLKVSHQTLQHHMELLWTYGWIDSVEEGKRQLTIRGKEVLENAKGWHNMNKDAPNCDQCGHTTVRNGACYKCLNCGNSMGCS